MNPTPSFSGNAAVVERLEAKVAAGRLPHALIFTGPEGVGKHTFALRMAQALNCRDTDPRACGICDSCRKISRGSHPDVKALSIEGEASQIRIEQVRSLRDSLLLEPGEGKAHVSIIDPADRLTPGAANALLKALEEPPERTFFFLITANANELLLTIRSRCQTYHFAPLSVEAIHELGVTDDLVARWSQGSLGRARNADPDELRERRAVMLGFLDAGLGADPTHLADLIGTRLAPSRDEHLDLVRAGYFLIGDMLRLKLGVDRGLINVDIRKQLESLGNSATFDVLLEAARQLRFVEANLRYYINPQMMTDAALVAISDKTRRQV